MRLKLDHLTILGRDLDRTLAFYSDLLPLLGFHEVKRGIWTDGDGFYFQFLPARAETPDYGRYHPGLNHLGFGAPDSAFVASVREAMAAKGWPVGELQHLHGAVALFLPDPDGLRVEVTAYPPGSPPVD